MSADLPYAVLLHTRAGQPPHVDLLLAVPGRDALLTWRLERWPAATEELDDAVATALPDHRRLYLDYEGPLTENRGEVRRLERGTLRYGERTGQRVRATLTPENGPQRVLVLMRQVVGPARDDRWSAWIAPLA